jgi:hypothetical protein
VSFRCFWHNGLGRALWTPTEFSPLASWTYWVHFAKSRYSVCIEIADPFFWVAQRDRACRFKSRLRSSYNERYTPIPVASAKIAITALSQLLHLKQFFWEALLTEYRYLFMIHRERSLSRGVAGWWDWAPRTVEEDSVDVNWYIADTPRRLTLFGPNHYTTHNVNLLPQYIVLTSTYSPMYTQPFGLFEYIWL